MKRIIALVALLLGVESRAQITMGIQVEPTTSNFLHITLWYTNLPAGTNWVEFTPDPSSGWNHYVPVVATGTVHRTDHYTSMSIARRMYRVRPMIN